MALKVGITGQRGFIGGYLYQYLKLRHFQLIEFERSFFENADALQCFVSQCDIIIHTAAVNRHPEEAELYKINVSLVQKLVSACQNAQATPAIIFTSSVQERRDNLYGQSKKQGFEILEQWSQKSGAKVLSCVIPNVFGPFGKPFYNSVIATFCHQLAHRQQPEIKVDNSLDLIYIDDLASDILNQIQQLKDGAHRHTIAPVYTKTVSEILALLTRIKTQYLEEGIIPEINEDDFTLKIFNVFRTYIPDAHYPVKFTKHADNRGSFVEIVRANTSGQFSYSSTVPRITRGEHFHTRKAERFAVISGKAKIEIRRIGTLEKTAYYLDGSEPAYVDMPIWHTHNITNVGDTELITLFWINEPYNPQDPDTYFEKV